MKEYFNTKDKRKLLVVDSTYILSHQTEFSIENIFCKLERILEIISLELERSYPEMISWFISKYRNIYLGTQITGIKHKHETVDNRPFILYIDDSDPVDPKLAAFSLLKKTSTEQKVCSLFVCGNYRSCGVGRSLLLKTNSLFDTNSNLNPFITLSEITLKVYPYYPHLLIQSGYKYDTKMLYEDKPQEYYFTIDKLATKMILLNNTDEKIIDDGEFVTGVIKP